MDTAEPLTPNHAGDGEPDKGCYAAALEIAGVRIRLEVEGVPEETCGRLREKYAAFETSATDLRFSVKARRVRKDYVKQPFGIENLPDKQLKLHAPGMDAVLDQASGTVEAWLMIDSPHPVENLLRFIVSERVRETGGALFHAAGLVANGRGYLFAGASESGKTTLAVKAGYGRALSDEMPALLPGGDGFALAATPFWGDMGHGELKGEVGLRAIALLAGKDVRQCRPAAAAAALQRLLATVFCYSNDPTALPRLQDTCARLVAAVPVVSLKTERDEPFDSVVERIEEVLG